MRSSCQPWRSRCTTNRACCSALFTATKRSCGWRTAAQIAAASLASFFPDNRNGRTNSGAMMRAVWPSAVSSRANQCALAHASIPTRHGGRCANQPSTASRRSVRCTTTRPDAVLAAQRHHPLCQIQPHGSNLVHDFPSPGLNVEIQSWHSAADVSRGSPFYSLNRTRRARATCAR